ncbi:MAG: sigma-70 family RNA polymerase sigma factor [Brachyspira sp.]|nr:sigma-70 family RNA polymerase sigma factor [Brachyspira sp.]
MELTQEKLNLIERIIKNDRKFANNEDLYDDFFSEMCKRSMPIVNTITSDVTLEAYLRKIATTSILNVLKDSGRLRRTRDGFTQVNEVSLEAHSPQNSSQENYSDVQISYPAVDYDSNPEDIAVQKEILQKIVDAIYLINEAEPDKQYLKIYKLRYDEGMTQKEIASEMSLSQSEISKRLFKLMEKVKEAFN